MPVKQLTALSFDSVEILLFAHQCPSKTFGGFDSTKDLPDEVITFARSHPAMYNAVFPINNRPIMIKTDVDYQFTQIVVDRVDAEDGQYDVMFIGTGKIAPTYLRKNIRCLSQYWWRPGPVRSN